MAHLKATFHQKAKSKKWLQDEHNRTFIPWLRDTVSYMQINGGIYNL